MTTATAAVLLVVALCCVFPSLATATVIESGEEWAYVCGVKEEPGVDGHRLWSDTFFDDSAWAKGNTRLGVGDDGLSKEMVPQYPDGVASYFRKTFLVDDKAAVGDMQIWIAAHDGAIVHVNGVEVWRFNLPEVEYPQDDAEPDTAHIATIPIPASQPALTEVEGGKQLKWHGPISVSPHFLLSGTNAVAVQVHASSADNDDIAFDLRAKVFGHAGVELDPVVAVVGLQTSLEVVRGPYLQALSAHSVVVRWRTNLPTTSEVRVGSSHQGLRDIRIPDYGDKSTSEHSVLINNLESGRKYFYGIAAHGGLLQASSNMFFVTMAEAGHQQNGRVWILGDAGTAKTEQIQVRDAYREFLGRTAATFMLFLGDNAYESAKDPELQEKLFDVYKDDLLHSPTFMVYGNHDAYTGRAGAMIGPHFESFTQLADGRGGGLPSPTDAYFSFDYGQVHFVVLDSSQSDWSTQATWLRQDLHLAKDYAVFLVATFHHPAYSKGSHDSDTELRLVRAREYFVPILNDGGVDIIFSGHSHSYERSMLIKDLIDKSDDFDQSVHVVNPTDGSPDKRRPYRKSWGLNKGEGFVQVVLGSSGKVDRVREDWTYDHPAMLELFDGTRGTRTHGSCNMDISETALEVRFIDGEGNTRDKFRIEKRKPGNPSPYPTPSQHPWIEGSKTPSTTATATRTPQPTPSRTKTATRTPTRTVTRSPSPSPAVAVSTTATATVSVTAEPGPSLTPMGTPDASTSPAPGSVPSPSDSTDGGSGSFGDCACSCDTRACCSPAQLEAADCGDVSGSETKSVDVVVYVGVAVGVAVFATAAAMVANAMRKARVAKESQAKVKAVGPNAKNNNAGPIVLILPTDDTASSASVEESPGGMDKDRRRRHPPISRQRGTRHLLDSPQDQQDRRRDRERRERSSSRRRNKPNLAPLRVPEDEPESPRRSKSRSRSKSPRRDDIARSKTSPARSPRGASRNRDRSPRSPRSGSQSRRQQQQQQQPSSSRRGDASPRRRQDKLRTPRADRTPRSADRTPRTAGDRTPRDDPTPKSPRRSRRPRDEQKERMAREAAEALVTPSDHPIGSLRVLAQAAVAIARTRPSKSKSSKSKTPRQSSSGSSDRRSSGSAGSGAGAGAGAGSGSGSGSSSSKQKQKQKQKTPKPVDPRTSVLAAAHADDNSPSFSFGDAPMPMPSIRATTEPARLKHASSTRTRMAPSSSPLVDRVKASELRRSKSERKVKGRESSGRSNRSQSKRQLRGRDSLPRPSPRGEGYRLPPMTPTPSPLPARTNRHGFDVQIETPASLFM